MSIIYKGDVTKQWYVCISSNTLLQVKAYHYKLKRLIYPVAK